MNIWHFGGLEDEKTSIRIVSYRVSILNDETGLQ